MIIRKLCTLLLQLLLLFLSFAALAQGYHNRQWLKAGNAFVEKVEGELIKQSLPGGATEVFLPKTSLVPAGQQEPLSVHSFSLSEDEQKVLIYTNTAKVWRYDTRGDYWVYDLQNKSLKQLGKGRPESSLFSTLKFTKQA